MQDKEIFLRHLGQTTPFPFLLHIEKAEGLYLYDTEGKQYADLISGIGVSNLGHRHPKIIQAIQAQLEKHLHVMVYGEYIQSSPNKLAALLNQHTPENLSTFYFVNSGTEANEAALKLAKRHTNRTEIISFNKSYHGNTHGSLSVSGNENKKYAFRPLLPGIKFIDYNCHEGLDKITDKTAAVIMETVQGDAGVRIPDVEFLKALRKKCDDTGALLILDEIQTGFGRTGTLFAFEQFGIVPDILTMAKAMGGGLPIGCFAASYDIMNSLTHQPMLGHITTFGGNPVCCAAALANLEVLTTTNLMADVNDKRAYFLELLAHPDIVEIRSIGFLFAIEFESHERVQKIVDTCLKNGIITFWFLSCNNSFRLAPPLTITKDEIQSCATIIREAIDSTSP